MTGQIEQKLWIEKDAVNKLIYYIIKHFIGDANVHLGISYDQLNNLKCPTMSHFKWYKDGFFTKVFARANCNPDYWK